MEVPQDVLDLLAVAHAFRIAQIPQIIPAEDVLALLAVHHAQHIAETLPIIQEGAVQAAHRNAEIIALQDVRMIVIINV